MTPQGSVREDRKNRHLWGQVGSWLELEGLRGSHFLWYSHISNNDLRLRWQHTAKLPKSAPRRPSLSRVGVLELPYPVPEYSFSQSTLVEATALSSQPIFLAVVSLLYQSRFTRSALLLLEPLWFPKPDVECKLKDQILLQFSIPYLWCKAEQLGCRRYLNLTRTVACKAKGKSLPQASMFPCSRRLRSERGSESVLLNSDFVTDNSEWGMLRDRVGLCSQCWQLMVATKKAL